MSTIEWGAFANRRYESGISHGVVYPHSLDGFGVVWNGLTAVEQGFTGGEIESYYVDGVKYFDNPLSKDFVATIKGFSTPVEFDPCVGNKHVAPGFILTRQPRELFDFSYRTWINNDDYKIHVVYNALVSSPKRPYSTITNVATPTSFEWTITSTPDDVSGRHPSSHLTIDTSRVPASVLWEIEAALYGTVSKDNLLPRMDFFLDLVEYIGSPKVIDEDPVTGLSPISFGYGDLFRTAVEGVFRPLPLGRLILNPLTGTYRLE